MDSEYYDEYCGNAYNGLQNPFSTKLVTVHITDAYEGGDDVYITESSEWLIVDATGEDVVRFDFVEFTGDTAPIYFEMDDGMICTGIFTSYSRNSSRIELECATGDLTCELKYD